MNLENRLGIKVCGFDLECVKFQTCFLPFSQMRTQIVDLPHFQLQTSLHWHLLICPLLFLDPLPSMSSNILLQQVIPFNVTLIISLLDFPLHT